MKSYWIRPESGKTVVELRDAPVPEPGPGQILLRMHAASLNRGELIVGHAVKTGGPAKAAGGEGAGAGLERISIASKVRGPRLVSSRAQRGTFSDANQGSLAALGMTAF